MPEINSEIIAIIISALLGGFLGIQQEISIREKKNEINYMGIRTQALIAVIGAISTFFINITYLPILIFFMLSLVILASYINGAFRLNKPGITLELSSLILFWAGVLVGQGNYILGIFIVILLAFINGFKNSIRQFSNILSFDEWIGAFQLLFLTAVVLPFLPNDNLLNLLANSGYENFRLGYILEVVNPFKMWLLVMFISGIGFVGYFLSKFLGEKGGIPLTGFLGAIVSSTAVTTSMASISKSIEKKGSKFNIDILVVGVLVAIATMMFRVVLEILVVGGGILGVKSVIIPIIMAVISLVLALYFYIRVRNNEKKEISNKTQKKNKLELVSPFEIMPAIIFGFSFLLVLVGLAVANHYFGNSGAYIVAFLSGFTDVDAITLSSIESVKNSKSLETAVKVAITSISIAVFMNTAIKILYIYMLGSKTFFKKMAISIIIIIISGLISLIVL